MNLDLLIFPTPECSYSHYKSEGEILYIPKEATTKSITNLSTIPFPSNTLSNKETSHIPCMFLKASSLYNKKYAIFFHGNAEDINLSYEILKYIRYSIGCNVIAPEYPGYGMYPGRPNQEQIYEDSIIIYDFLVNTVKIPWRNLILIGRSLGTSPSTYLSSQREVAGLVLISPMYSIKRVVKDLIGKILSSFIVDTFENYKYIPNVKSPILIIHGQNDVLINYKHSIDLYNLTKSPCELVLPEHMDHNEFDFYQEFSEPLVDFISRNDIYSHDECEEIEIEKEFFICPEYLKGSFVQWNILSRIFKFFTG